MSKISLQRSNEFINRFRDYHIYIDGNKVGSIANGETKSFDVGAGTHQINAKIDWCSSPEVSATTNVGDTKQLKVGGFKNANWLVPTGLIFAIICFPLKQYFNTVDWLVLLVIPFAVMFYYVSFGRKKYLTLKEI